MKKILLDICVCGGAYFGVAYKAFIVWTFNSSLKRRYSRSRGIIREQNIWKIYDIKMLNVSKWEGKKNSSDF